MGDLIELRTAQQRHSEERSHELWLAFCQATRKAQASLDYEDGIAAGKAWAAWLDSFRAVYK